MLTRVPTPKQPCSECGRLDCWAKRPRPLPKEKILSCEGWFPMGCLPVLKRRLKRGRRGMLFLAKGEEAG